MLSSQGVTPCYDLCKCLLFGHEFSLGDLELCLSLYESLPPWSHLFGDDVVLADCNHPLADPFSSLRSLANLLWYKLWISQMALDSSYSFWWDVVLVILLETVEEFLIVIQELL